ncbi:hypothetical protein [Streptomyces cyaneofuscatus]|uniref:hypothetical protein n=1 Tax=Streptomyces cyaneofuscatus TaxID=66883 RepID=UPI00364AA314
MFKTSFCPTAWAGEADDIEAEGDTGAAVATGVALAPVDDGPCVLLALSVVSCVEPQATTGTRQVNRAPAASHVLGMWDPLYLGHWRRT